MNNLGHPIEEELENMINNFSLLSNRMIGGFSHDIGNTIHFFNDSITDELENDDFFKSKVLINIIYIRFLYYSIISRKYK